MAMTGILRPGHVQLRVLDIDEAVTHYCDYMGLIETDRDTQGRVYLKCWDEHDKFSVVLKPSDRAGIDHMAFKVGAFSTGPIAVEINTELKAQ